MMSRRAVLAAAAIAGTLFLPATAHADESVSYAAPGASVFFDVQHVGGTNTSGFPGLVAPASGSAIFVHPQRIEGGNIVLRMGDTSRGAVSLVDSATGSERTILAAPGDTYAIPVSQFTSQNPEARLRIHDSSGNVRDVTLRDMRPGDPGYDPADFSAAASGRASELARHQAMEGGGLVECDVCTIRDFIRLGVKIFNWLLAVGGVAALLAFIVAGVRYLLAVYQGGDVQGAKQAVVHAIVGLVVLLLAVVIVRTVTVVFDLQREKLGPEAGEVGDIVQ